MNPVDELMALADAYCAAMGMQGLVRRAALESRLRNLFSGDPVAWSAVADDAIRESLNSDEVHVVYFDRSEVPTGDDAKGFAITPLFAAPQRIDVDAISERQLSESRAECARLRESLTAALMVGGHLMNDRDYEKARALRDSAAALVEWVKP